MFDEALIESGKFPSRCESWFGTLISLLIHSMVLAFLLASGMSVQHAAARIGEPIQGFMVTVLPPPPPPARSSGTALVQPVPTTPHLEQIRRRSNFAQELPSVTENQNESKDVVGGATDGSDGGVRGGTVGGEAGGSGGFRVAKRAGGDILALEVISRVDPSTRRRPDAKGFKESAFSKRSSIERKRSPISASSRDYRWDSTPQHWMQYVNGSSDQERNMVQQFR